MTNKLREERERLGLRKAEMARRVGLQRSHYGRIERGESRASYEAAQRIAAALNRTVSEIQILELYGKAAA